MNLAYPYRFAPLGNTAETADEPHIRDLIEQVLFTSPGERVMRPDFGSGVAQLVFAPNSVELASATQMLIQGALQQWLGNLIRIEEVAVDAAGEVQHGAADRHREGSRHVRGLARRLGVVLNGAGELLRL